MRHTTNDKQKRGKEMREEEQSARTELKPGEVVVWAYDRGQKKALESIDDQGRGVCVWWDESLQKFRRELHELTELEATVLVVMKPDQPS